MRKVIMNSLTLLAIALPVIESFAQDEMLFDSRDGKKYKTIKIGKQVWMAENLSYAHSVTLIKDNGKRFREETTDLKEYTAQQLEEDYQKKLDTLVYCLNDSISNCAKYGAFYTYQSAQNACPSGWRLPSLADFKEFLNSLPAGKSTYNSVIEGGSSGFNAKLSGVLYYFDYLNAKFYYFNKEASFWTSTKEYDHKVYRVVVNKPLKKVVINFNHQGKPAAFSVRCIKN